MLRDATRCWPGIEPRARGAARLAGLVGPMLALLAGCAAGPPPTPVQPTGPAVASEPPQAPASPGPHVAFDFETGLEGWSIPEWAREHEYYVPANVRALPEGATSGERALVFVAQVPAEERWRGGWVEVTQPFDWGGYDVLSADVSLPADMPEGVSAGFGLSTGDDWRWVQLRESVPLRPGETATLAANIGPGSEDWREDDVPVTVRSDAFRSQVQLMAVYFDFPPEFEGEARLFVDNIRLLSIASPTG